ncbi:MAG: aminopeptidase P family protein, partial [Candidatus Verstraetearchaeota archaeon]|nr:aminopeptidase P family protein [Candidatus Verstraetearchaeota archaeon]
MHRVKKLLRILEEEKLDAFISFSPATSLYFHGFGGQGVLVKRDGEATLFVPKLDLFAAEEKAKACEIVAVTQRRASWKFLLDYASKFRRIGVERGALPLEFYFRLRRRTEVIALDKQLAELRAVKDDDELRALEKAAQIAVEGMRVALESVKPGVCEVEIAGEAERAMRREGAEAYAFDTIVASGPNAAYPHGKPGTRKIQRGDVVVIDLGAKWNGYCSDMTRTVIVGSGSKWEKILKAVQAAMEESIRRAVVGASCRELYFQSQKILAKHRVAKHFIHGLGHGVGIEVHESPLLNAYSREKLAERMVITIEPGVYLRGKGGVRIEDMIVVTEKGVKVLTQYPRVLIGAV